LGLTAHRLRDLNSATEYFERSIRARPGDAVFINNLGSVLVDCGRTEEAAAVFRHALALVPGARAARANLLYVLALLPGARPEEIYAEHLAWASIHADPLLAQARVHRNSPDPERRLRIGYVSADFRRHALSHFVEPVLARHEREAFEVYCYYSGTAVDEVTARLMRHAQHWNNIAAVDDARAAQLIRADGIDILIDVSGHTRGNRLLLFARKPAPLQVSYLGYLNTTGMKAIDYRISDSYADPPGVSDSVHTEKLLRLPRTLWCYLPPQDAPPVSELPALRRGHVTFASFNDIKKLNPRVLELWAALLRQVPGSRLLVMGVPDEEEAARIRRGLAGIEPDRVRTQGRLERDRYWRQFAEVDIALDPFPYAGGTTTCDTLWMGVPVVTLAGDYGFSRSGVSILANAGLSHLVAQTAADYLSLARGLAGDHEGLARLRAGLRERLRCSPLTDASAYMRDLESAYRNIWRDWCGRQGRTHA
jgi:protein O-GlcNAc transferase